MSKTLNELMIWTQEFHREMAERFQQAAKATTNERSRMLLEYLAGHENQLEELVERFREKAPENALNTLISEYKEQFHPSKHDSRNHPYATMETGDILHELEEQHRRVIRLYDHFEDFVQGSAREVLTQLVEQEEQTLLQMVQSANRLEDI
ncbi:hypothetical protein DWB84_06985 [Saccharophagus sp. K07]|jgi:hypothetical protein|uniref:hypothetical protein n=1 Tax=Saccharophagus sp. K07 TaxID=2283636 RepID=UPI0016523435|nr:hypothetical protein [Saccharophagus sp. K07]MBC6905204.1 hypothetical protein [Saccharophagus sp. K07]